jgi:hypothetical protein
MDSAARASRILARIQAIDWADVDKKLPKEEEVKPTFEPRPGTTTAGTTPRPGPGHDPNATYAGNWNNPTGTGTGPIIR